MYIINEENNEDESKSDIDNEECHKGMYILEEEKKDKEYCLYFFSSEGIIPLLDEGQNIELLLDDIGNFFEFYDEKTNTVKDIQEFITNNININDDDYKYELPICDNSGKCFKLCFKGNEDLEDLYFYFKNISSPCFYVKKNKDEEYKLYFTTESGKKDICSVYFKEKKNLKDLIYYILEKNFQRKTTCDVKLTNLQVKNNFNTKTHNI